LPPSSPLIRTPRLSWREVTINKIHSSLFSGAARILVRVGYNPSLSPFPPLPFLSPSSLTFSIPLPFICPNPLNPARMHGKRCKLPQRVRADPSRQTVSSAVEVKKMCLSCYSCTEQFLYICRDNH